MVPEPIVLTVDDEPGILRLIKLELSSEGYRVLVARTGSQALELAEKNHPDIVIIDLVMPEMGGLEVMRRLRERENVPVILLTGMGYDRDKVGGLDLGADDYMVKPFNPEELGARVKAVLRRTNGWSTGGDKIVRAGNIEIDLERRLVTKAGESLAITRVEWRLLHRLAVNAGKVMLNEDLLRTVWGPEFLDDIHFLRTRISRLRNKLEQDRGKPDIIKTLPGIGYMLETGSGHKVVSSKPQHIAAVRSARSERTLKAKNRQLVML